MFKTTKTIFILILISWLAVLSARSALYVLRIVKEFSQPVKGYYGHIVACKKEIVLEGYEQERYYFYQMLGTVCKK